MKKYIIVGAIILVLFLSGCTAGTFDTASVSNEEIKRIANNVISCEDPYMRYATGCCLDENNNSKCDGDETEEK